MEIYLVRTNLFNLNPATDEDAERVQKMRYGVPYRCEVKMPRNWQFHKKFWALIGTAWEFMPNDKEGLFGTMEGFRQQILITAGHAEKQWSIKRKEFVEVAKSISFASLDDGEFSLVYDSCKNAIFDVFSMFGVEIDEDIFMNRLIDF